MIDKLLVFASDLKAAGKVLGQGVPWSQRRSARKYQNSEGDMITGFTKRWPKPFPTKTFRSGLWIDNK